MNQINWKPTGETQEEQKREGNEMITMRLDLSQSPQTQILKCQTVRYLETQWAIAS